jgi:hypothetical protein
MTVSSGLIWSLIYLGYEMPSRSTWPGDRDGCRGQMSWERGLSVERGRAIRKRLLGAAVRRTYVAVGLAVVWPGARNVTGVMVQGR